jgi:hypothetical protein
LQEAGTDRASYSTQHYCCLCLLPSILTEIETCMLDKVRLFHQLVYSQSSVSLPTSLRALPLPSQHSLTALNERTNLRARPAKYYNIKHRPSEPRLIQETYRHHRYTIDRRSHWSRKSIASAKPSPGIRAVHIPRIKGPLYFLFRAHGREPRRAGKLGTSTGSRFRLGEFSWPKEKRQLPQLFFPNIAVHNPIPWNMTTIDRPHKGKKYLRTID